MSFQAGTALQSAVWFWFFVSGDLIRAGVKPGPELGQLLNAALEAVIEDNIPNDRETLLVHLNLN